MPSQCLPGPWLPTEPEKVAAFEALSVEHRLLPRRVYRGAAGNLRRYFPLRLPVALDAERAVFVYVDPGHETATGLRSWGAAHCELWEALWDRGRGIEVVVVVRTTDERGRAETVLANWARDPHPSEFDHGIGREIDLIDQAIIKGDVPVLMEYLLEPGERASESGEIEEGRLRPDRLRGRRLIGQRAMRSDGVVLPPPLLDEHLCLLQRIEDLALQHLVAERSVEAPRTRFAHITGEPDKFPARLRRLGSRTGFLIVILLQAARPGTATALPKRWCRNVQRTRRTSRGSLLPGLAGPGRDLSIKSP